VQKEAAETVETPGKIHVWGKGSLQTNLFKLLIPVKRGQLMTNE